MAIDLLDSTATSAASSVFERSDSVPASPDTRETSLAPSPTPREAYERPKYLDPSNFVEGPLSDVPAVYVLCEMSLSIVR